VFGQHRHYNLGGFIVNVSYKIGLAVSALLMAGTASAADLLKGPYISFSYVTQSTCGSLSPALATGSTSVSAIEYPGAGAAGMVLGSPSTTKTSKPGSASTSVCVATTNVPSGGLNGATLTYNCYGDTDSGPAAKPVAKIKSSFKVGNSHSPNLDQVTVTSSLFLGTNPAPICGFTSDGTWSLE
jgi:hypothetical protein